MARPHTLLAGLRQSDFPPRSFWLNAGFDSAFPRTAEQAARINGVRRVCGKGGLRAYRMCGRTLRSPNHNFKPRCIKPVSPNTSAAALLFCSHKDCCPLLDSVLEVVHSCPDSQSGFQRESPIVSPRDTDTINPKPLNPKPTALWNIASTDKNAKFEPADLLLLPRKNRVHRRVGAYMALCFLTKTFTWVRKLKKSTRITTIITLTTMSTMVTINRPSTRNRDNNSMNANTSKTSTGLRHTCCFWGPSMPSTLNLCTLHPWSYEPWIRWAFNFKLPSANRILPVYPRRCPGTGEGWYWGLDWKICGITGWYRVLQPC